MWEEINEEQLKNKIKNAVNPKRTTNLEKLLNKLIEKDKSNKSELELEKIIYDIFKLNQSIPINQNQSTSQQFSSVGSQFDNNSNKMDIVQEFGNNNNEVGEINVDAEEDEKFEFNINKIYESLVSCNDGTINKIFNEVKQELEPELTEVSKIENN